MEQLSLVSAKGGAGKTSVSAALANLADWDCVVDADVDGSNLPILLQPEAGSTQTTEFMGMPRAQVDPSICTGCGQCAVQCRFEAISMTSARTALVDPADCEGCGLCMHICPAGAIQARDHRAGIAMESRTADGKILLHARLNPGEDNSGKLISQLRQRALQLGRGNRDHRILIDGPPGTSCAAISALSGVQYALLIVESSVAGVSDMQRMLQLLRKMRIRALAIANKWLPDTHAARELDALFDRAGIRVAARISFDERIPELLNQCRGIEQIPEIATELRSTLQAIPDLARIPADF